MDRMRSDKAKTSKIAVFLLTKMVTHRENGGLFEVVAVPRRLLLEYMPNEGVQNVATTNRKTGLLLQRRWNGMEPKMRHQCCSWDTHSRAAFEADLTQICAALESRKLHVGTAAPAAAV